MKPPTPTQLAQAALEVARKNPDKTHERYLHFDEDKNPVCLFGHAFARLGIQETPFNNIGMSFQHWEVEDGIMGLDDIQESIDRLGVGAQSCLWGEAVELLEQWLERWGDE